MKTKKFLLGTFFFAATMALVLFSCQKEQVDMNDEAAFIKLKASVQPVLYPEWKSGDAEFECNQAGNCGDFAYKVDEWDQENGMDGEYTHAGNVITIDDSDGYTFSWSSVYPVCQIVVKAATGALVYSYPGGSYGDTELIAPYEKEISHVSFCFTKPDMCYEEETAWAEGARYVNKGNWAMYVDYYGVEKTVELIADYTNYVHAGTVTFSAPVDGNVTITVNLTGGAIFYYDLNDPLYDDNLKVQDYATAPKKTPAPGQFAWKTRIEPGLTTGSIVVPANKFYGVHLDVAVPVDCE